ncbi:hypothetical protein TVAG_136080 [Trichomonas vaginalis G3]|uniref:Sel1 repeat family protein n=1 Tax=Trichomonas vaginalis (strain ATCC PRA-98 / G3) TaxID=412133 RepID=A2DJ90_TRIV3|nr:HCP-like family [Trichomonas vaginalis G3]EAY19477.1 hypothetical protein TVAG_136080 [Trichomonas vaginalis G3]KAI5520044.1 HCP-like family [Trichomonas vaginalis G3]|eukprot:XP_001580463.1 hypothetical protein [Trichomonas vaginalis G3]
MLAAFLVFFARSKMKFPDIMMHDGADELGIKHIKNIRKIINNKWGINYKKEFLRAFNDDYEVNYEIIANLSKLKFPPALYVLGEMYLYGIEPVTMNISKAYELYSEAAKLDFPQAYAPMAFIKKFGLEENSQPNKVFTEISDQLGIHFNSFESIFSVYFDYMNLFKKYGRNFHEHEAILLKDYVLNFHEHYVNPTFTNSGFDTKLAEIKSQKRLNKYKAKYNAEQSHQQLAMSYFNGDSGCKKNYTKAAEYARKLGENHTLYKTVRGFELLSKGDPKQGRMTFIDGYQANDQFSKYCNAGASYTYNDLDDVFNKDQGKIYSLEKIEIYLNNVKSANEKIFSDIMLSLANTLPSLARTMLVYRFTILPTKYNMPDLAVKAGMQLWDEVNPNIPNQNIALEWYNEGKADSAIILFMRIANSGSANAASIASKLLLNKNLPGKDRNYTLKTASRLHRFAVAVNDKYSKDNELFELAKKYNLSIQMTEDETFNKVHLSYAKISKVDNPYDLVVWKLEGNMRTKLLSLLVNMKALYLVFPNLVKTTKLVLLLFRQLKIYSVIILILLCWRIHWIVFSFLTEKRKALELEQAKEEQNNSN